jgi:hypothetical protein
LRQLASWNDAATTKAIVGFAETAARDLPPEERVAVFDNDGTIWCEKPMPIELGFILQRFVAMAEEDGSLREKQPWKATHDKDFAWLGGAVDKQRVDYVKGAEQALEPTSAENWTVVSVKDDWTTVFAEGRR